jgi:preprotein translocase subunit SecY
MKLKKQMPQSFGQNPLFKKILITIILLAVYRLGSYIPLPFVDVPKLASITKYTENGILGMLNMLSGGSLSRMSIFTLTIVPYISASIIIQLSSASFASLKALKSEGSTGQAVIHQYTKYLTCFIAFFQGFAVAKSLVSSGVLVSFAEPTFFTLSTIALTLSIGTLTLMWIGERITANGIGNGISLIIFVGIVIELPKTIIAGFGMIKTGVLSPAMLFVILAVFIFLLSIVIFVESSFRIININQPNFRQAQLQGVASKNNFLPLKINPSGVIPPIFASSILLLPSTVASFAGSSQNPIIMWILANFTHGTFAFMFAFGACIVFFTYFYTSIVFDSKETADQLKKSNALIQGIRPGQATASYISSVIKRLNLIGSVYLIVVCLMPEILFSMGFQSFVFGGTSLLIIVSVSVDTITQFQMQMMSKKYQKKFNSSIRI